MSSRNRETAGKPFVNPIAQPVYYVLGIVTFLCVFLLLVRGVRTQNTTFAFLLWNLFLAWLPLFVSIAAARVAHSAHGAASGVVLTALGVGWLLLYPNAPYLTTDFIHLIFRSYSIDSLILWYDLVIFFLFAWCGLLIGYVSLRHFHAIVRHFTSVATGWVFVITVALLSGFGIYLGRVLRFNSWDALFNPFRMLYWVLAELNRNTLIFTGLFGLLIFILYLSLYALRKETAR